MSNKTDAVMIVCYNDVLAMYRKHPVEILLPIFAVTRVPFVKSIVRYAKDLGILNPQA